MDFLFVALIWGVIPLMAIYKFRKLSEEEKREVIGQVKQPSFMFTQGFRTIGLLLMCTGIYFPFILRVGAVIFSISWFATGYSIYDKNRIGSIFSIIASIVILFIFFGPYFWGFMV